jgi:magnesium-transporting ATPase (P-type)
MDTEKPSPRYPWGLYFLAIVFIVWGASWFITYRMTGGFHYNKYDHEYRGQEAAVISLTFFSFGITVAAWSLVTSWRVWKKRKNK